jgi:hypothetical protein
MKLLKMFRRANKSGVSPPRSSENQHVHIMKLLKLFRRYSEAAEDVSKDKPEWCEPSQQQRSWFSKNTSIYYFGESGILIIVYIIKFSFTKRL